jgi:phospholipid N-methyltransferase
MAAKKLELIETGPNTGTFTAKYLVPRLNKGTELMVSYGYFGLGVQAVAVLR